MLQAGPAASLGWRAGCSLGRHNCPLLPGCYTGSGSHWTGLCPHLCPPEKGKGGRGGLQETGYRLPSSGGGAMGGWHASAEREIKKLGSALARHTGQLEGEAISHLWRRLGILLQRGNEGRGTPGKLGAYLPRTTHRWHNWIECISSRLPIANVISFALSLPPWVCHPEIYIQKTYWTYLLNLPNFPGLPDWTGLDNVCIMSVWYLRMF